MTRLSTKNTEADTLSVINELLTGGCRSPKKESQKAAPATPDPAELMQSLKAKRELIDLLDGHIDKKDISAMKKELDSALSDLNGLLKELKE